MDTYQIEIIEPKAKRLLEELVNLNLIRFQRVEPTQQFQELVRNTSPEKAEVLRTLFKVTQSLPQAQSISEEEIAAEIAAHLVDFVE